MQIFFQFSSFQESYQSYDDKSERIRFLEYLGRRRREKGVFNTVVFGVEVVDDAVAKLIGHFSLL